MKGDIQEDLAQKKDYKKLANFQSPYMLSLSTLNNSAQNRNMENLKIENKNTQKTLKGSHIKWYSLEPAFPLSLFEDKLQEDKSHFDFQRSLKKALSAKYNGLLFGEGLLDDPKRDGHLHQTLTKKLHIGIQVTSQTFLNKKESLQDLYEEYGSSLFFNMFFENTDDLSLKDMTPFLPQMFFTYIITKKNNKIPYKQKLTKNLLEKTELIFPYKKHFFDPFLTPRQVYKFIKKQGALKACPRELYDSRIAPDMDLEPLIQPFLENSIPQHLKKIFFSIIIPSYNNKIQLLNTLKNLALQDCPRSEYEVILVDDGSTDDTKTAVKYFMEQHPSLNMKALSLPRVIEKKPDDNRFRAGIARNLGAKHSEGAILAFLDADILVPPYYLQELKKEHEKADLVLLKRYHLKRNTPLKQLFFDNQKMKNWCYIEEKKYWGDFYNKGFDKVKTAWKYICTYGLSLSKADFQSLGAFGKNFVFYGFEDTDLGYRLFKQKKKFLLSDMIVYHQPPLNERKAYNPLTRHNQLSKTAKIFFYKHLDPAIYEELKIYMTQKRGLSYFFPFLS